MLFITPGNRELTVIRHILDQPLKESSLVRLLTERGGFFVFSYSPSLRSLVSWSDNALEVLGVQDVSIVRDGNLFLRHVHPDDRFLVLSDLEKALASGSEYRATYRWVRPDTNEVRWLHCRAQLTSRANETKNTNIWEAPDVVQPDVVQPDVGNKSNHLRQKIRIVPAPLKQPDAIQSNQSSDLKAEANKSRFFEGIVLDLSSEFTGSVGALAGPDSLATVLASFPLLVFTLDPDFRLLRMNRSQDSQSFDFGDPAFNHASMRMGRPFLDCFGSVSARENFRSMLELLMAAKTPRHRSRIFRGNAVHSLELLPLLENGVISGILGIVSDISETVALERKIGDLQKAEGLRLLAAGVAHHVNNALQSIIGHASVISSHPDNRDLVTKASESIIEVVGRTAELSKQLHVFEEPRSEDLQPFDANLSVMTAVNSIEDLFRSGLKVSVAFGNIPNALGRHSQFVEALQAILRNACDALPEKLGSLSVTTHQLALASGEIADLSAGDYVRVAIADTGCGMNATTLRRCLEPFFTTKDHDPTSGIASRPSGLGLSKAYAILREFKGGLTVDSSPGKGSVISIFLPLAPKDGQINQLESASRRELELQQAAPQVFFLDDDPMVRETTVQILESEGIVSRAYSDPQQLLAAIEKNASSLRAILIDALIPGTDSSALVRQIRQSYPDLVIFGFTGAAADSAKPLLDAGVRQIIRKPIDPRSLRRILLPIMQVRKAA